MDTQSFENKCHSVKEQVNKNGLFLRVCKLKDKFRYLIKQNSKKKTVLRELSSCVIEKFNGFSIIPIEFSKKLRQSFHTISIIYKPVIKCYCHKKLNLAVTVSYNEGQRIKSSAAWQYYFILLFYFILLYYFIIYYYFSSNYYA